MKLQEQFTMKTHQKEEHTTLQETQPITGSNLQINTGELFELMKMEQ